MADTGGSDVARGWGVSERDAPAGHLRRVMAPIACVILAAACTANPSPTASPTPLPCDPPPPIVGEAAGVVLASVVTALSVGTDPDRVDGSFRLCLEGIDLEVEGRADCRWSEDRTAVTGIFSWPVELPGETLVVVFDRGVSDATRLQVLRWSPGRETALGTYDSVPDTSQEIAATPDMRLGRVDFAGLAFVRPADADGTPLGGPAGPLVLSGALRWSCREAPPPEPGFASGQITLQLDAPVRARLSTKASCWWTRYGEVPFAKVVDGEWARLGGDRVAAHVWLGDGPDQVSLSLSGPGDTGFGEYGVGEETWQIGLARAPDGRSGRLRFVGLGLVESADDLRPIGGQGGPESVSGIVSWQCGPAPDDSPVRPAEEAPHPPPPTTPGVLTASLRERLAKEDLVDALQGDALCATREDDEGNHWFEWLSGTVSLFGETVTVRVDEGWSDRISIYRVGPDGTYLGEYLPYEGTVIQLFQMTDDGTFGEIRFSDLPLNDADPSYLPLGGPDGPRRLAGRIVWECAPPGS